MKTIALCTFLAGLALVGCGEKNKATKDSPTSSSSPNGEGGSPAPPVTSAAPVASAKSAKTEWAGTYTLAPGTLSIPSENKDYSGVKQAKDDPSKLMGDGKIDLVVEGSKVTGTVEGGAGPAVIDGSVIGEEIRGTVRRKDPKDDGLTGTLTAKIAGDSAEGKLNLSEGNAAIVREAKVALKKK
jgi:hypothetical protein